MNKTMESHANSLKISEDVIARIAEIAVGNIDGVESFTKSKIKFGNLFCSKDDDAAIDIHTENGSVEITVNIIVSYNCKVKQVAEHVQEKIKSDVQNMTGIIVSKVNVIIDNISFEC